VRRSAALLLLLALAGCSRPTGQPAAETPDPQPISPTAVASATPSATPVRRFPRPGGDRSASAAPSWLGTRPLPRASDGYGVRQPTPPELDPRAFTLPDTVAALPGSGFAARVGPVPDDVLARSTWQPACPVTRDELAYVRLTFWGFDDQRHTGELLVNASAARDLVTVFRTLYRERFPIEQMRITTRAQLDADPTGDGNDTESFVCRPSVGSSVYSQHAYGLAVDVDPFQNPYVKGDLVIPELASAYATDRTADRAGVIVPDGAVVRAFASIGWTWGGSWSSLKDFQHFSANGR
jgi:hypothetical protein